MSHVASQIDLRGLDVLEVGSGRGGGAAYLAGLLGPSHMNGVNLSRRASEFCKKQCHVPSMQFVQGDKALYSRKTANIVALGFERDDVRSF